jgi:transcriptional regulator with XRE-family HTH domain
MPNDGSNIPAGTGARIKARRVALELTQAQVADRVAAMVGRRYRENWLAQIERGNASLLLNAAIALADVLTMSLDEMLGRRDYMRLRDIIIEPDESAATLRAIDSDLAPVEGLRLAGGDAPTPPDAKPPGRQRATARPRRT